MSAQIIVTLRCTWDGDAESSRPEDIDAYNAAMDGVVDYCEDVAAWVDGITFVGVEATG
jgi:hypothetical protein